MIQERLGGYPQQAAGGQVFVPAPHAAQFCVGATPKQRRKHHSTNLAQQLLLASQAAFNLCHQLCGETQVLQGLLQGLSSPWSLAPIALEALLSFEAATLSGFRLCFDVSFDGGHSEFLRSIAGLPLRHVLPYFLLFFAGHLRDIWALTASAIPAPSSARLMHG